MEKIKVVEILYLDNDIENGSDEINDDSENNVCMFSLLKGSKLLFCWEESGLEFDSLFRFFVGFTS